MIKIPLLLTVMTFHPIHVAAGNSLPAQATVSRADSDRVTGFLRVLASAWTPASAQGPYDPHRAGPWDTEKLLSFFARGGVTFHDINGDTTWHLTSPRLRGELGRRRGSAFDMLIHLGYIYTQPYPQYSQLSFVKNPAGVVVRVGAWYEVTFVRERGILHVAKVDYTELEGE